MPSRIYTVSELTAEIRAVLEDSFSGIWLEGEISNFRLHSSGHMYFTLKDEESQIKAAMFRYQNRLLKFKPQDGLQVLVFGIVTLFERRGEYQISVEYMEPKGVGALQLAYEQLKERLAQEGLFDAAHKKPIPLLPRRIGLITSPTGAVICDILQILDRRFANLEILIYPVAVQGETAAPEIVTALQELNRLGEIDVLILARGGGSIEDLWAFNEEVVARAIYNSKIPVISAVGHETDYTIADFVADLRAPTPSAAAELVVARKDELAQRLDDLSLRMATNIRYLLRRVFERLNGLVRHLALLSPQARIRFQHKRLEELYFRLTSRIGHRLELARASLLAQVGKLDSLSPLAILSRGYSICRRLPSLEIVKDASAVIVGEEVAVILHQGELLCRVEEVKEPSGVSNHIM
ncbi:MAG: exodeoxyribonuclease VII large subunit [candidate division NC10 bacterium]|nr:exodeoxyribonuclease VII large subunit [candidate division NC10 bacterium]